MKVSTVVTVYNLRSLAPRAVASVLLQSRPPDEVIVVDDGSTDGSADVLHAEFGKRIQLVRLEKNVGVLRATVEGLRRATGDVVSFLDGDDVWEDDKIRFVAAAFEGDPSTIFVSHDYRQVDAEQRLLRADDPLLGETRTLSRAGDATRLDRFMRASVLEYRGHVWLGSAYSLRRRALDLEAFAAWVEGLPDATMVYQDHPLATFLLLHDGGRAAFVDRKLFRYVVHDDNYSSAASDLARAMRIVEKGLATRRATLDLVRAAGPVHRREAEVQEAKVREYEFLGALYEGRYARAAREFAACACSVWGPLDMVKEASRMASVALVGPERFFEISRRRREAARRVRPRLRRLLGTRAP